MSNYRTAKNLLTENNTYNRYYGDFRGVDFSNDHTQIDERRFAYLVNMFKDYQTGEGTAVETIPGFRRRVNLPKWRGESAEIFGIHRMRIRKDGKDSSKVLIHSGKRLYLWKNYPLSLGVIHTLNCNAPEETPTAAKSIKTYSLTLDETVFSVTDVKTRDGVSLKSNITYHEETHKLTITTSVLAAGDPLTVYYTEGEINTKEGTKDILYEDMNERRSTSFMFNNRLYLIDGKNYLVYDGETVKKCSDDAYVPTTYINITPSGTNADTGKEYEQRNILQPKFRHTFIADGETTDFYMNELFDSVQTVKVYGKEQTVTNSSNEPHKITSGVYHYTDMTVDGRRLIRFCQPPKAPQQVLMPDSDLTYPEQYAGIEIEVSRTIENPIPECTIATVFDNRVFLSGNPNYPNEIFYCHANRTGNIDPTYFGVLDHMADGIGVSPITGMIPVADTLAVFKSDTEQDGAVYFHTAETTGDDLVPVRYPSSRGLPGIGCLGACVNFLDDPIFVSRLGVEAIGQLSVRYERAVEHRSSLIDAKLTNLNLSNAALAEWNGYLVLLADGKIFLADSRQRYTHAIGTMQYEWYYLEGIGVCDGQYTEYLFSDDFRGEGKKIGYCTACHKGVKRCTCGNTNSHISLPVEIADRFYDPATREVRNVVGKSANPANGAGKESVALVDTDMTDEDGNVSGYYPNVRFFVQELKDDKGKIVRHAYYCESRGNAVGGTFFPATSLKTMDENLFFGTKNGVVCSFNFDKRGSDGSIAPRYYTFDDRTIECGVATKMDCCGIPHLTKSTVKKSTVVKIKTLLSSAAKIKVRTNNTPFRQVSRLNSQVFSFDDVNFSDFAFVGDERSLFSVGDKDKKWVEKQYYIYSDEFMKPFALYYIAFRYTVAGRYKE